MHARTLVVKKDQMSDIMLNSDKKTRNDTFSQ